jgi:hypothetical protein
MIRLRRSLYLAVAWCALFVIANGVAAFSVGDVSINPSGNLYPGNTVNVSYTVYAASGAAFPSYDDLQFVTELDDPAWIYLISVNGVKSSRPVEGGKTLTINGFELGYKPQFEVDVEVTLRGTIPSGTAQGTNKTLVRIQELDARGYSIAYSAVNIDHLIGEPTPLPTPAYGSIAVTSSPAGADIYIDNVYKGLSPAVFGDVRNGDHRILVKLGGYQDLSRTVTVTGDNQTLHAVLSPLSSSLAATPVPGQTSATSPGFPVTATPGTVPGFGALSITTTPPGALVYIDGSMMGITPATIPMLSEGSHNVTLIMDGYQDLKTTIVVNEGTTSEYITGLAKTTKTPGFTAAIVVVTLGLVGFLRKKQNDNP